MMHERSTKDVHEWAAQFGDEGRRSALALVLAACGSTPSTVGAQAILDSRRVIAGTVGGGQVEAEVQRVAEEAIRDGCPQVVAFNLEGTRLDGDQPICGGSARVLVDPAIGGAREAFAAAAGICRRRKRGVLLTRLQAAEQWRVQRECLAALEISSTPGFPGAQAIRETLQRGQPRLFVHEANSQSPRLEVFVEPLVPSPQLLIVGGGHVGRALAAQAALVGFQIVVVDDRPEFADPARFPPDTVTQCGEIAEQVSGFPSDPDTYLVIVTRGHQQDAEALAAFIGKPAAYIGMIGSRRKAGLLRRELVQSGRLTADDFARVYTPVGLDIGSVTVPEIAASIVAQMIAVRRRGTAPRIEAEA